MTVPTVNDIKVFVPAKDFDESLRFYTALGWQQNWLADDYSLAVLELADHRFYLQNYYNKDWADNFMLHITVADANAWWEHAAAVIAAGGFKNARFRQPKEETYGALVTYVWDPSGVLLHFAQFLEG
ncbi:MAG: VOC family protein [Chloroflexota bacterium]